MKQKHLLLLTLLALLTFGLTAKAQYTLQPGDKVTTDEGVFVVSGANLISNPNFDDGLTGWKAGDGSALSTTNFEVQPTGGPDGLPCLHALKGAGSGSAQSVKTGWALEAGKTYVFRCYAYRTASGMSSNTQYSRLYLADSETGTNQQIATINYKADTWTLTQVVFTATRSYLVVNLGWLNAASSFTAFYLGEVTASSELSTDKLEASIAEAKQLLASTEEGDGKGQYKPAVRAALQTAITTAEGILASATEQTQLNEANTGLQTAIASYKAQKNRPFQVGVGYNITNVGANLNLATLDGGVKIKTADSADSTQVFYFALAPSGEGYNIHDANGTYLYKDPSSNWEMKSGTSIDLTSKDALFTVVDNDSYVLIKNANRSYLGTDATTDGASVYDDKNGGAATHQWVLTKHTPTAALETLIASARNLLATTEVGTEYYQVPQSAADDLATAIAAAAAACTPSVTYEEAAEANKALQAAVDAFKNAFNPLPDFADGQTYVIRHSSGLALTTTETGNATITNVAENGASQQQLFTLEKAGTIENQYTLRSVSNETYLSALGDWNTQWAAANTSDSTIIRVERLDGKYLGLKFIVSDTYLGSDATTNGSLLYFNKAAVSNSYWTIEPNITVVLDRTAYNATMAVADSLVKATVIGYKKGMYFQADLDAFKTELATLRSNAGKAQTQEALDGVTAQLAAAIEAYKGKAHEADILNRNDLQTEIAKAIRTHDTAVAGDCNGQYPAEAIVALRQAISDAQAVADKEEITQEAIDAALATLKQAEADFAATKVTIDYTALQTAIAQAQKALTDNAEFKGEGAGKIPAECFTTLETAVANAQAAMRDNQLNQEEVAATAQSLGEAVETFLGSRVKNDYTELQALVDEATELIGKAERGEITYEPEYLDDLKASLEKNGAALESTDQDVIDKAAKMLRRDITIFKLMVTGIDRITLDDLNRAGVQVKVYDLNGRQVSQAEHGLFIVSITTDGVTTTHKVSVK